MATLPENMRKGVTYYITLKEKGPMIRGEFRGRDPDGCAVVYTPTGVMLIHPGKIVGASAVRS